MSATSEPRCPFVYPSPEVIEDPFPFYAWLRAEAPVHRLEDGSFLVSRWDDIAQIVRHPELYSNKIGPTNDAILGGPRLGGDASGPWPTSFADLPEHRPQRVISSSLVTRERLASYEPIMLRNVDLLIDSFAAAGTVEFRSGFASLLPRRVMMDIFGFPAEDEPDFIRWSSGQGPVGSRLASPEERAAEQQNRLDLAAHFERHVRARVDEPRDDYLTVFVQDLLARDGEIDMPYALVELTNLFAAGNGTTAHMLTSALLLLLEHPDELERVRADHSLIPPMLEETIRLEGPIQWNQRIAMEDVELQGVPIPRGSMVLINWAAANRDESKFAHADRFEIERPGLVKQHLAYGQGIHKCLGVPVARLEGRIAMERLLDRLRNLRLAGPASDVRHIPNLNQRAPAALQIAFDPS
jgi:cytochrome P450